MIAKSAISSISHPFTAARSATARRREGRARRRRAEREGEGEDGSIDSIFHLRGALQGKGEEEAEAGGGREQQAEAAAAADQLPPRPLLLAGALPQLQDNSDTIVVNSTLCYLLKMLSTLSRKVPTYSAQDRRQPITDVPIRTALAAWWLLMHSFDLIITYQLGCSILHSPSPKLHPTTKWAVEHGFTETTKIDATASKLEQSKP
ncbi:hypothetical protein DAI22_10g121300 [Oryza sativa Japonica Group]|nr:uncharacterized protein LOC107279234 isoform X2 [Oryza sativa Japonica Group]KAF2913889.1 hypothetical protein DAI22_10g121300 [Oryza sativa Japonica Group]